MALKQTYQIISLLIFLSCTNAILAIEKDNTVQLTTTQTEFVAGSPILLEFLTSGNSLPKLYISNSYGNTIITPKKKSKTLVYKIPEFICNKKGILNWKLLNGLKSLSGKIKIRPRDKVKTMETYLGPPSIIAGGLDYSMFVIIPTDKYDNPLKDGTPVEIKHQFLINQHYNKVIIKNGISYKNLYSETKTGRMLVSSECLGINSKEYTVNILPDIPTDFTISFERHHYYADGNQITTFFTSPIKDTYGNMVSDGTYVQFQITNQSNAILKTSGTTINGVATAKMIHPDHEEHWSVKAIIESMAESNTETLAYINAITQFDVVFSNLNRTITVGPLKSFMNQMIPDGFEVTLSVFKKNKKIKTLTKGSFEGFTKFKLNTVNFPSGLYSFKIETAGIEKFIPKKKL